MKNILLLPLIGLMFSCTQQGNQKINSVEVSAEIKNNLVNENFGGVGFHVFDHVHNGSQWHYDQVFAKRWRELNPSFVRINDDPTWDTAKINKVSKYLEVMKGTNTEMYFTSFNPKAIKTFKSEMDYVKHEVDNLEYWKKTLGFKNLNYYCMANELSLDKWASMVNDLEYFKKIHGLFYNEIKSRDLGISLLATDSSPFSYWHTIEWASKNMDEITGVYGGHHYINDIDLFDNSFYNYFLGKIKWGTDLAKSKNKRFIVGEFGAKQNSNIIDSVYHDCNMYNNTPLENYMGIQIAEAITAMINAGAYGCGYWTFADFPSNWRAKALNKWGLYRWEADNYTTKPTYYCLGLLTKFFRGPSEAYEIACSDSLIRMAAVKNKENGSVSVVVINRNELATKVKINMGAIAGDKTFRKYLYDPADVPFNYFGDLQDPCGKLTPKNNNLVDVIPPQSMVVYTTCYDDEPPADVKGLQAEKKNDGDRDREFLKWEPSTEKDFCYYRIYRSEKPDVEISARKQIASTISNNFIDISVHNMPQYYYHVIAVDQSGNPSK
jgi:hypothetical protein